MILKVRIKFVINFLSLLMKVEIQTFLCNVRIIKICQMTAFLKNEKKTIEKGLLYR